MHDFHISNHVARICRLAIAGVAAVSIVAVSVARAAGDDPSFEIVSGLESHQVLQRDESSRGALQVSGALTHHDAAEVEARVLRRHVELAGFSWAKAGQAEGGAWSAHVSGIPVGGPYDIEFRLLNRAGDVLGSTAVYDILVGDLWILSGQSNMVGNGRLVDLETPHELVHQLNPRYEWQVAEEPLDSLAESYDEAHWGNCGHLAPLWAKPGQTPTGPLEGDDRVRFRKNRQHGAGLALTFAKHVVQQTAIPIGLIPCAHGGTSMSEWDPALKHEKQKSLYGAMLVRLEAVGGKVKGLLWYQGEADMGEATAEVYEQKFGDFIKSVRADFSEPELPFYYVQIGRFVTPNPQGWDQIQEAQRQVEQMLPHVGMVVSVDQPIDDIIHISGAGLKALGQRMAKRVCHDVYPEVKAYRDLKGGPRPKGAVAEVHRGQLDPWADDRRTVVVDFTGVNGSLQSLGRPSGFSLRQPDGSEVVGIFRTLFDPESPTRVLLEFGRGIPNGPLPPGTQLWYGWGLDPYCNLTDEANLAVPAFGPLEIEGVAAAE